MRAPALASALALVPSLARAHGAPPVSEQIVLRGAELLVPTHYWGVFFGTETTPWRWICEEAINKDQSRAWALTLDGTYHVTDYAGLTSSRDGGCTWIESTGDIASRSTSAVVADPVDGKRAWATTNEGASAPWNALFTTPDDGLTWTPVLMGDEFFRSPVLSSDGKTIYVAGTSRAAGAPSVTLHVSKDGGATFASVPIAFSLNGAAQSDLEPLAVDPSDPGTVWLAVRAGAMQVLLQATNHGAAPTERFRLQATIGGIGFDPLNHAVLVPVAPLGGATLAGGFMRSVAGAPFAPFSNLHAAQCVLINGATIYACSSEFPPDSMAIGRSDDGGAHFTKVFRYDETVGPTTSCPPDSPVGATCPLIWEQYASQLGINLGPPAMPDAGSAITPPPPHSGCNAVNRVSEDSPSSLMAFAAFVLIASIARKRSHSAGGSTTSPSE